MTLTAEWIHKVGIYIQWYTHTMEHHSTLKRNDTVTCYNMGETWGHYAKWNKSVTKGQILWFHSYEKPIVVKFIETKSRMVVARGWQEEIMGNYCFNRYRVSVFQDEESSGDGWWWWLHKNINVFNVTELYTQKWLRWQILCSKYSNKKLILFLKWLRKLKLHM